MIVAWLIGLILSFLGIWFLKNSRTCTKKNYYGQVTCPGGPILKVWSLSLLAVGTAVPILNILVGLCTTIWWAISVYGDKDWEFTKGDNKLIQFLNKPIE